MNVLFSVKSHSGNQALNNILIISMEILVNQSLSFLRRFKSKAHENMQ